MTHWRHNVIFTLSEWWYDNTICHTQHNASLCNNIFYIVYWIMRLEFHILSYADYFEQFILYKFSLPRKSTEFPLYTRITYQINEMLRKLCWLNCIHGKRDESINQKFHHPLFLVCILFTIMCWEIPKQNQASFIRCMSYVLFFAFQLMEKNYIHRIKWIYNQNEESNFNIYSNCLCGF